MNAKAISLSTLFGLLLLAPLTLSAQAPAAPANLAISAATSKQVVLTWSASSGATSYVVQRSPLGDVFASLTPSATTTTFTDTTIDAYTTYLYVVYAVSAGGTSTASNEVEMGPPTVGFSMIELTPTKAFDPSQYGVYLSMALDTNGDPAIAFVWSNPSNSGNLIDSAIYFVGWDRTHYQWKTPVQVDVCGLTNSNSSFVELSLAVDQSTGVMGIAYEKNTSTTGAPDQLGIAFSSNAGATWTLQTAPTDGINGVNEPFLALSGGQAYLAFYNGSSGDMYETGSETAKASSWKVTPIPLIAGANNFEIPLHLALDSTGAPAVAYWFNPPDGSLALAYWRPGSAAATQVLDTAGDQPVDVRLAFSGTQPRILYNALPNNAPAYADEVWITTSTNGTTWTTPVPLPNEVSLDWGGPLGFAVNSAGAASASAVITGGGGGKPLCGNPKWSQSSNLVNWTTCSPQGLGDPVLSQDYNYPAMAYGANNLIYFAFDQWGQGSSDELPSGIILYRQPLVAGQVPPNLSAGGAVNGASFTAGGSVAPGSIISIFGTHLATTAGGSTFVPLSTTLVSTSVTIAGTPAPLYYVGPGQINAQLPFQTPTGSQPVSVNVGGLESNTITVPVAATAPGIFLYNGNYAVAQTPDYSIIGPGSAVPGGSVIILYATGEGAVNNQPATGAAAGVGATVPTAVAVTATVGGKAASVQYAGLVQGFVGLLQVNLQLPTGLGAGSFPLVLTIGGTASNSALLAVSQ